MAEMHTKKTPKIAQGSHAFRTQRTTSEQVENHSKLALLSFEQKKMH